MNLQVGASLDAFIEYCMPLAHFQVPQCDSGGLARQAIASDTIM